MLCTNMLVPKDHLLRKIDAAVDFTHIYDLVEDLYCEDNGRPSIDPVVLFKLVMIQHLFGIRSLRQTMRDAEVNVAYRWFLGYRCNYKLTTCSYKTSLSEIKLEKFLIDNFYTLLAKWIGDGELEKKKPKPKPKFNIPALKEKLRRLNFMYMEGNKTDEEYKVESAEIKKLIEKAQNEAPPPEPNIEHLKKLMEIDIRATLEKLSREQ